ncbi:gustatory and pheromone receptor 39a-like [Anopheles cruzii]|uniref:gustatory and pheromone receptor 39a-like n=1 Tax=Anopheles cruzii TaxID=68878 RepID=UPI0022EC3561|nr:gustatory and pheromone receptor 39a-like [Anopheles cruzii]
MLHSFASKQPFAMEVFREQKYLLTILGWCAIYPYAVPVPTSNACLKTAHRWYFVRLAVALLLIVLLTYVRFLIMFAGSRFLQSLSYLIWLVATLVDTFMILSILITNALNLKSIRALVHLLERVETVCHETSLCNLRTQRYRWLCVVLAVTICILFHSYVFQTNYDGTWMVVFHLRVEVLLTDWYVIHLVFLLWTAGHCAKRLKTLIGDCVAAGNVTELCRILRLRDDLLRCIGLINRVYGVLFLVVSASWFVSITAILYFDFILNGKFIIQSESHYAVAHSIMFVWKCIPAGSLLMVAGYISEQANEMIHHTCPYGMAQDNNRPLQKMIDKLLVKSQFQDTRFTAYGMFAIDNSLNYTVISSIVTYLVILMQFRQLEIDNENQ